MPRIPESELEHLKREVSLQRLVEAKGIELTRHGQDLIGLCPFHNDKDPSLVVSPAKNLWHCLGACQAGGSVIDWVMKSEAVSFRHAVELLRADAPALSAPLQKPKGGRPAQDARTTTKDSTVRKLDTVLPRDVGDAEALQRVVDYYHAALKQSPDALGYLSKRGLTHPEMVDHFKLGFANRTLCYHLPTRGRREGAELRGRLQALGVLRDSGHEHMNGSVVIPIFDAQGRVVSMYGRKVGSDLRLGTPHHLYLPGPHRGVWNLDALKASDEIILCEALIDALTFWCAGFRNVTSAYGIEGFTDEHLAAFKQHNTKRVLIAYDRDEAGDQAAAALGVKLLKEGIGCYRVQFPRGMDANEYALSVKPADKSLGLALLNAQWLGGGERPTPTSVATAVVSSLPPSPRGPPLAASKQTDMSEEGSMPDAAPAPSEASDTPPASLAPPPTPSTASMTTDPGADEVVLTFGERRWRIRGLAKNTSYELLRVNVLCSRGEAFHVDTLDLYSARQRAAFTKQASLELGVSEEHILKSDMAKVLLSLEAMQESQIRAAMTPKEPQPTMTDAEREQALELLCSPSLIEKVLADFDLCGVVGESTNKLLAYIATVSRKMFRPLAVIIQSSSAAGKSALMDAVLSFIPEEERVKYSAMTGQSLFYMGETELKHKVLAIAEEAGAEKASYALKLLQSEGELCIASTGKDPATGRHVTHVYRVEGPVMIILTTTAIEIDEELLNRCLVLTVDEGREQTRAIHQRQRQAYTLDGLFKRKQRGPVQRLHQNAQRLLRPLAVVNPYAEKLTFLDEQTRTRRDHEKYLVLINAIALLHQYQRVTKRGVMDGEEVEYIEATLADIALANKLANEILGHSLDELPPQTRRLLLLIEKMVAEASGKLGIEPRDYRFSRREIRECVGWGNTQLKHHLKRLEELEYLLIHKGGRGQSFVYELLYNGEGKDGGRFLVGLLDPAKLDAFDYDEKKSGVKDEKSGSSRPQVGGESGPGRGGKNGRTVNNGKAFATRDGEGVENSYLEVHEATRPYVEAATAAGGW